MASYRDRFVSDEEDKHASAGVNVLFADKKWCTNSRKDGHKAAEQALGRKAKGRILEANILVR